MDDHPYVYPYSRAEARRLGEEQKHEDSFRLNVECARAIERAIREHFNEASEKLEDNCAQPVLDQYGFTQGEAEEFARFIGEKMRKQK